MDANAIPPMECTMDSKANQDPILNLLSPDCRSHVFSFLSLFDCFCFGETSKTNLEQIIAQVERRRHDQFLMRPCEELMANGGLLFPRPFLVRPSEVPPGAKWISQENGSGKAKKDKKHPFLHHLIPNDGEEQPYWYLLPSIAERIEGLYRSIPATHPFNDDLKNLVADLKKQDFMKQASNGDLLKRLSCVTYAHRMHASLLSRCTTHLQPVPYQVRRGWEYSETFTVTLDQYLGDVLSARCLIGHSYYNYTSPSGYYIGTTCGVEGGPSFGQWINHLPTTMYQDPDKTLNAMDWYQYWVLFHSTLLRVAPFTVDQAEQLNIGPLSGILEPFHLKAEPNQGSTGDDANGNGIASANANANANANATSTGNNKQQHPSWFLPSRTYSCYTSDIEYLKQRMVQLMSSNAERVVRFGKLETTMHYFGPLGPSFRGRDRVETETMFPHKFVSALVRGMRNRCETDMVELPEWLNDSDRRGVMRWMKRLQEESRAVRPMNVQSPLVTIRMMTLHDIETD